MSVAEQQVLTLEDVIRLVEGDLPGWMWMLGRCKQGCDCGHNPEEPCGARLESPDYLPGGLLGMDLRTGQPVFLPGTGHRADARGATAAEALSRAWEAASAAALS